jgi:hypothetical protein
VLQGRTSLNRRASVVQAGFGSKADRVVVQGQAGGKGHQRVIAETGCSDEHAGGCADLGDLVLCELLHGRRLLSVGHRACVGACEVGDLREGEESGQAVRVGG